MVCVYLLMCCTVLFVGLATETLNLADAHLIAINLLKNFSELRFTWHCLSDV